MKRKDLKAGDTVHALVKDEKDSKLVFIVKRRCTEYARCYCKEIDKFWDIEYNSMIFTDPERNMPTDDTEDECIYAPKSKIEKEQITIYGAGIFHESNLVIGKARAAVLMCELWEFLNLEEK